MLRNGEQLLLAVVIPVLVLVGGVAAADRIGLDFATAPSTCSRPGVLALAVMSTSFTSLAIATGFERRYGVLKRLGASPLPAHGLLLGKVVALLGRRGPPARRDRGVGAARSAGSPADGCAGALALVGAVLGTARVRLARPLRWPAPCAPRRRWPPRTWSTCCC